jgi:ligand-binding SRPBCC domain-containing protein
MIEFVPDPNHSGVMQLKTELQLSQPIGEVFDFFANASNLEMITPPSLRFRILTPQPIEMAAGTLIDYRLSLHGIPVRWRTEISVWVPPRRFVDRQLLGPYRLWEHTHSFRERDDGGTVVEDVVRFRAPGGKLVLNLFIRPELQKIFAYRQQRLLELFSASASRVHHV